MISFTLLSPFLPQSHLPAPRSSSPAPQVRSTVFLWPGAATVSLNVKMAAMRRTAPSALPPNSSVTRAAALMPSGAATENPTVPTTQMSRTVKVSVDPASHISQNQILKAGDHPQASCGPALTTAKPSNSSCDWISK